MKILYIYIYLIYPNEVIIKNEKNLTIHALYFHKHFKFQSDSYPTNPMFNIYRERVVFLLIVEVVIGCSTL